MGGRGGELSNLQAAKIIIQMVIGKCKVCSLPDSSWLELAWSKCINQNVSPSMYIFVVATAGEEGRKCLMREIELGKLIGENVSPNIVKFMGCVTTESKY